MRKRLKNVWDTHKLRVAVRFKSRKTFREVFFFLRGMKMTWGSFSAAVLVNFSVMKDNNMLWKFQHWMIYAFLYINNFLFSFFGFVSCRNNWRNTEMHDWVEAFDVNIIQTFYCFFKSKLRLAWTLQFKIYRAQNFFLRSCEVYNFTILLFSIKRN